VLNRAVEREQHRARLVVNDRHIGRRSGKPLDGFHRIPESLHDELDGVVTNASQEIRASEAGDGAQTWQNGVAKVLMIKMRQMRRGRCTPDSYDHR
jgi:hypothetical protein